MDGSVGTDAELAHTPEILHIMNRISELIDESFPDTTVVASLGVYTIYCALLSSSVSYFFELSAQFIKSGQLLLLNCTLYYYSSKTCASIHSCTQSQ